MFNVGGGEVLVILMLALIVLGPDKLPNTARQAGRYLSEFRRMTNGFQTEIRNAMDLTNQPLDRFVAESAVDRTPAGQRTVDAPTGEEAPAP